MNVLLTAFETEAGNIITPKGLLLYPALFRPTLPKGETDEKKAKHQATLLVPKGANIDALKKAAATARDEKVTAKMQATVKIRSPFLQTIDQPRLRELAEAFPIMLRCNSTNRPDVVTPKGDRTVSEDEAADEVYSGRWCRFSVRPFFYDHPTGGKGVSFGLQNVQLLDHGDPIVGARTRGVGEFEAVEVTALDDFDNIPF